MKECKECMRLRIRVKDMEEGIAGYEKIAEKYRTLQRMILSDDEITILELKKKIKEIF